MKKKLKPSGNGWEFYFSKPFLKLLGYNPTETKILITSKDKSLYFQPIENEEKYNDKMVRNFQKSGGSYGIYLPKTLIEILNINPEIDLVEIIINDDQLIMRSK